MKTLATLTVVLCLASIASGELVEGFEEGTYAGAGTVVDDLAYSGTYSLFVDNSEGAVIPLPVAVGGEAGTLTMMIYDQGKSISDNVTDNNNEAGNAYGPRWGVTGASATPDLGSSLTNRTYNNSSVLYWWSGTARTGTSSDSRFVSNWYSGAHAEGWFRQATLDLVATPAVNEAVGAWSKWIIKVNDLGEASMQLDVEGAMEVTTHASVGTLVTGLALEAWVYGGTTATLDGVWVDDITWTAGLEPTCIPGDADCDGIVDIPDFVLLKNNFGVSPATWGQGDFDGDGVVDIPDFVILKNNFGNTAVPEPATMSLLALGGLAVIRRRRS